MVQRYRHSNSMELGYFFTNHLSAMTGESLHSKFDIAEELAYRDQVIDHLVIELNYIKDMIDAYKANELKSEHIVATLEKYPLEVFTSK